MADASPAKAEEAKPANPFAALGGTGTTFGTGAGAFSFGGAVAAFSVPKTEGEEGEEGGDDDAAPEEECKAEFQPIVQLEEVATATGEEDEAALVDIKCKLYRYDNDSNEWKERGIGQCKLLQHKQNKKVRLLMRQEKTLKIRANHLVLPGTNLTEHSGSDKAWVWSTIDFAEEKQQVEMFCVRFGSVEKAQEFKKKFEEAMDINAGLLGTLPTKSGDDGEAEADKLAGEVESKATV